VRLESDEMITEWGFKVDAVLNGSVESEWNCSKFAGGYDFVNYDSDPMDDQGHGTHVAGIVAANGNVTGVAPDARIVAYKVLDEGGSGTDEDIIAAIEMTVDPNQDGDTSDHWDIISMSLGGSGDPFDAMSQAVDNAVDAGVVVVVAAGNSGPDSGTVDSPGCARKAITVGAAHKVNQSQGERNSTLLVTSEDNLEIPSLALEYSNTTESSGIVRRLEYVGLGYPGNFSGKNVSESIVLIERGEITFSEKVSNAYSAGAAGAVIYNNYPGNFYGTLGNDSAIPAVAISQENGTYLKGLMENKTVEVNLTVREYFPLIAEFSSRGPVYIYQKPDVLAPGVLICSTRWNNSFSDGTPCLDAKHIAISGTSMATPHVAGAGALLLQAHPEWSPLQVKAALENTAQDFGLPLNDEGAGLINVYSAAVLARSPPIAYISNLSNMEYV
jgi:minor extracellular serine protease Vpr